MPLRYALVAVQARTTSRCSWAATFATPHQQTWLSDIRQRSPGRYRVSSLCTRRTPPGRRLRHYLHRHGRLRAPGYVANVSCRYSARSLNPEPDASLRLPQKRCRAAGSHQIPRVPPRSHREIGSCRNALIDTPRRIERTAAVKCYRFDTPLFARRWRKCPTHLHVGLRLARG